MKTLEVQNFVSGSVRIAECEWDWTEDRSKASFISKEGVFRTVRLPDGFLYQPPTIAHLVGTDCIIAVHRTGRFAWQLSPQTGAIREAAVLSGRDSLDQGLMSHRFEAAKDRLLLLYEGGVIAFGAGGNEAWHHDHVEMDASPARNRIFGIIGGFCELHRNYLQQAEQRGNLPEIN